MTSRSHLEAFQRLQTAYFNTLEPSLQNWFKQMIKSHTKNPSRAVAVDSVIQSIQKAPKTSLPLVVYRGFETDDVYASLRIDYIDIFKLYASDVVDFTSSIAPRCCITRIILPEDCPVLIVDDRHVFLPTGFLILEKQREEIETINRVTYRVITYNAKLLAPKTKTTAERFKGAFIKTADKVTDADQIKFVDTFLLQMLQNIDEHVQYINNSLLIPGTDFDKVLEDLRGPFYTLSLTSDQYLHVRFVPGYCKIEVLFTNLTKDNMKKLRETVRDVYSSDGRRTFRTDIRYSDIETMKEEMKPLLLCLVFNWTRQRDSLQCIYNCSYNSSVTRAVVDFSTDPIEFPKPITAVLITPITGGRRKARRPTRRSKSRTRRSISRTKRTRSKSNQCLRKQNLKKKYK